MCAKRKAGTIPTLTDARTNTKRGKNPSPEQFTSPKFLLRGKDWSGSSGDGASQTIKLPDVRTLCQAIKMPHETKVWKLMKNQRPGDAENRTYYLRYPWPPDPLRHWNCFTVWLTWKAADLFWRSTVKNAVFRRKRFIHTGTRTGEVLTEVFSRVKYSENRRQAFVPKHARFYSGRERLSTNIVHNWKEYALLLIFKHNQ